MAAGERQVFRDLLASSGASGASLSCSSAAPSTHPRTDAAGIFEMALASGWWRMEIEAVGYLHHPLRAEQSVAMIRPALDLLQEIRQTGSIFFPKRWLDATLGGHRTVEAATVVQAFLNERTDLPPRLRGKVLQSADGLFRAVRLAEVQPEV